jgi:hypothetical protein
MEKIFKAKRLDNGKWKEFGLFDIGTSAAGDFWVADKKTGSVFNVDKKTISQYTGIDDSEGRKIFDNDEVYVAGVGNVIVSIKLNRVMFGDWEYQDAIEDIERLTGHNIHDKG